MNIRFMWLTFSFDVRIVGLRTVNSVTQLRYYCYLSAEISPLFLGLYVSGFDTHAIFIEPTHAYKSTVFGPI